MEYKTRIDEMKHLVSKKKFSDAKSVADTINWRKVQNINDLLNGSEVYEAAGKMDEAKELLLLAHERSPIGRMILYKLCMISIKLNELEEAQEYFNEYVQIAPHESQKYVLKYNLNVAKGADNATLIKILEQLKESDFIEEWAYELAYLYHKTNQGDKCISLCNEIILWFGDGPVVERALELKMLYQPLDKSQEDKYRNFQQKKDGITEIRANESLQSGEIVTKTIQIKSVEPPQERFNTVNLQAEIKKNIEEIMKATEKGEVNENIDAIKTLVEEIPYLQVQEEEPEIPEPETFSVNDKFNALLAEGFDGQMSLVLPDESSETETQVEGQMTIEDVLAEWEKTKRAAETALKEAKIKELEDARAKALREANQVLSRLENAMNKMEAGVSPNELLKEEYLSNIPQESVEPAEAFAIPRLDVSGTQTGSHEIPVVHSQDFSSSQAEDEPIILKEEQTASPNWQPPVLEEPKENDDVDLKEASALIADVNKMLQSEIDRLSDEVTAEAAKDIPAPKPVVAPVAVEDIVIVPEPVAVVEPEIVLPEITLETEIEPQLPAEDDFVLPTIALPEDLFEDTKPTDSIPVEKISIEEDPILPAVDTSLPKISEAVLAPEELAELVDEKVLSQAIKDEVPNIKLTDEDLTTFSYFLPIKGMKNNITQVLAGAIHHIENPSQNGGNIIIIGDSGTGKTQMATNIITALQNKTGKPSGGIGKINGENLNTKDIQKLFSKIQGGCLIIEGAGDITKETAVTFSLLMEHDTKGTIIIIEDTKKGIDKLLRLDSSFAKRFTEKIVIPTFSIDELVSFAKTYASEAGFAFDEMGILALYNRINISGRLNHATTIGDVATIMDEAMKQSSKGGLFSKPKYDKHGNIILKEKDFEK